VRLDQDDSQALAAEVLMVAIEKFRTKSLRTWSSTGGASLRAYFIGCCLLVVGQVYDVWYRRERRPFLLDPGNVDDGRNGHRPDEEAEASVLVDQLLADDPDLRRVLELQDQGYSLEEIAGNLGTTPAGLKSRKYRARQKLRGGGRGRG
jgi:DNA-directed RNA polymerase specialized sigma24 family protein